MQVRTTYRDTLTPRLKKALAAAKDQQGLHQLMGQVAVQLTKQAWVNPAVRPAPWAPKKRDNGKPLLVKHGTLKRSATVVAAAIKTVSNRYVIIGSDRPYASVHQRGGKKSKIPARPFFPFTSDGKPTPHLTKHLRAGLSRRLGLS